MRSMRWGMVWSKAIHQSNSYRGIMSDRPTHRTHRTPGCYILFQKAPQRNRHCFTQRPLSDDRARAVPCVQSVLSVVDFKAYIPGVRSRGVISLSVCHRAELGHDEKSFAESSLLLWHKKRLVSLLQSQATSRSCGNHESALTKHQLSKDHDNLATLQNRKQVTAVKAGMTSHSLNRSRSRSRSRYIYYYESLQPGARSRSRPRLRTIYFVRAKHRHTHVHRFQMPTDLLITAPSVTGARS